MFKLIFKDESSQFKQYYKKGEIGDAIEGVIIIDDDYETFLSSTYIERSLYKNQWNEAYKLLENSNISVFITDYYGHHSKYEFCGEWWILYKNIKKNKILIKNEWIPKYFNKTKFCFTNWQSFLPTYSNDDAQIWEINKNY